MESITNQVVTSFRRPTMRDAMKRVRKDPLADLSQEAWDLLGMATRPKGFHATGVYAISAQALKRRKLVRFVPVFTKGRTDGWQVYATDAGRMAVLARIKEGKAKAPWQT